MSYNPVQDHAEVLTDINAIDRDCYFPMDDFITEVKDGALMDDDGIGYLCIKDKKTNISIEPSEIGWRDVSRFDGVIWYNK